MVEPAREVPSRNTAPDESAQVCFVPDDPVEALNNAAEGALESLVQVARDEAQQFVARFKNDTGKEPRAEFLLESDPNSRQLTSQGAEVEAWAARSPELVAEIVTEVQRVLSQVRHTTLPGHDSRHIHVKDTLAALQLLDEEKLSEYQKLFLIPAALHDIGKFVELRDSEAGERYHPEVGFLVAQKILDKFQLPDLLRDHLLDAVLAHGKGNSKTSFLAQAVQRADREQLVGPEMLHRNLIHGVGIKERTFDEYLGRMDVYMRNLFPQIGEHGEIRASERKAVTGTFIWLAASEELQAELFAPELEGADIESRQKPLSDVTWDLIQREIDREERAPINPPSDIPTLTTAVYEMATPPHARAPDSVGMRELLGDESISPHRTIWSNIEDMVAGLDDSQRVRFARAVDYAVRKRQEFDSRDEQFLESFLERHPNPASIENRFASQLRDYLQAD